MSSLPLVSIVTPSYNQGQFLEQTIQSVLAQDYPRIEYVVMDGGSTDGSLELIQRYSDRLAYWESQHDRGQAHAINKGLARAGGELLGWLNSDDVLLPSTVSRVVEAFASHPEIDVVYGRLERMDARGELVPTPLLPKDEVVFGKGLVIGECVVNQPGSLWRRRVMQRSGMLDESLDYALDYEYWIRLALDGARFLRLPESLARFRLSGGSKSVGHTAVMAREQLDVLESLLDNPDLAGKLDLTQNQVNRQVRKARGAICLNIFYGYTKLGEWRQAGRWLSRALRADPLALFQRRWLDLAAARLRR
jgi:glycosyltransferase involved in cell wall biosynthesis